MKKSTESPSGETRICPHCKATILKSAVSCPVCHHFLRFEALRARGRAVQTFQPLKIEGTLRQSVLDQACEYSVVVAILNDRGEEMSRQLVAVGAFHPWETRTFRVWVEVYTAENAAV